jgi:hypothetical protein
MKLLPILLLTFTHSILPVSALSNPEGTTLNPDSLIFQKTGSKKHKFISVKRGVQLKVKPINSGRIKGFVHELSADSLKIVSNKGLESIHLSALKKVTIYHDQAKSSISSELISKGTLIAIPATLGLILSVRESIADGDLQKQYYQATAILGLPAAALIISGSLLRRKKLRMTKWSVVPFKS